jgi:hypothetical protein
MDHAPKEAWLNTTEGKAWLEYAFRRNEAGKFTSLTIIMVLFVFGMRIYDVPLGQILLTLLLWIPTMTAIKSISYVNAKERLEDIRKKLSKG